MVLKSEEVRCSGSAVWGSNFVCQNGSHNRFSVWKVRRRCPAHRNNFFSLYQNFMVLFLTSPTSSEKPPV
jgi:hypothetical protein